MHFDQRSGQAPPGWRYRSCGGSYRVRVRIRARVRVRVRVRVSVRVRVRE
jgi:hypothetical protein